MTITLNIANCLSDRIGSDHGLSPVDLTNAQPIMAEHTKKLAAMRSDNLTRWRDLPFDPMRSEHLNSVKDVVAETCDHFKETHGWAVQHLIVLGIGGSALGNIALQSALNPHTHNLCAEPYRSGPCLYVLDNIDPSFVGRMMRHIQEADPNLEHTLINVISKSGETAETASQFIIFRDWLKRHLGDDRFHNHIVAVTDPEQGTMRSIVDREGYKNLPVPDGVGGRFSVLSPVGLFSAAMCDIDIDGLLDGAAEMDERCTSEDLEKNPAARLAWLLMEFTKRGKGNHVLMPYANALYSLADWFRQLWAESLGKQTDLDGNEIYAGATPIKALGATDQHSQIQLYREGPNDKVIGFLEVEKFDLDLTIPTGLGVEKLAYLEGKTLSQLLQAEKKATEYALVESNRPNFTIHFPEINAHTVGQFIQLWQITTAYAGLLLNINPYDQPAVETGKKATFGLMGRAGYEEYEEKVNETLGEASQPVS